MSVGTDLVVENINMGDAIFIINHYLDLASDSFCDSKLRVKSTIRNWLTEGISNLGSIEVLNWSQDCTILGTYIKDVKEQKDVRDTFAINRMKRYAILSLSTYNCIQNRLERIKCIGDVEQLFRITQSMSNDRTYYKTLVELSLDAAVKPHLKETLLVAPEALQFSKDNKLLSFSFKNRNELCYGCENYLLDAADSIGHRASGLDLNTEWLRFLTTSSAGKRMNEFELKTKSSLVRALHNKRLVRVALEAEKFRQMSMIDESVSDSTILVVRQQIDRRQRAIAGLSNAKLMRRV